MPKAIADIQATSGLPVVHREPPVEQSQLPATAPSSPPVESSEPLTESGLPDRTDVSSSPVEPSEPPLPTAGVEPEEPLDQKADSSLLVGNSEPPAKNAASSSPSKPLGKSKKNEPPSNPLSKPPGKSNSSKATSGTPERKVSDRGAGKITKSEPISKPASEPLTQAALAKRLEIDKSRISRVQSQPHFSQWSQERDPEGIAWQFDPKSKRFYPI